MKAFHRAFMEERRESFRGLRKNLVALGHDVTLFASGDSMTRAGLIPACKRRALRLDQECIDPLAHHMLMIERVFGQAEDFRI